MAVAAVWTRNREMRKITRQQLRPRSDVSAQGSLCWSVRDSGVVEVVDDLAILCRAIHECAILAIGGPKMKSSTRLCLLSMLRMKMTRKTSSSWDSTFLHVVGLLD